ncbi:MAG: DUF1800 domain-containing protein [Gammaproteobacteria bacterium]|nr:DUF1800 domain-containing protein [Gammaproteobacteria bacterium]
MVQRRLIAKSLLLARGAIVASAALALAACAAAGSRDGSAASADSLAALRRDDSVWLGRVSFGLDTGTLAAYRRLGRERYLDEQLRDPSEDLPAPVAAQIRELNADEPQRQQLLQALQERRKAINALPDGPDKEQARKALNDEGGRFAYQAIRLELLRAVYSPAQLREQMVWFWLNHFSVFQYKADLRWLITDYEERAIRPYALGRFRDLVLATLEHPAMLQYLDNSQNALGQINENYARELMELHTLGVNGGYSQQDVQQLARVLTGVGVNAGPAPHLKPEWQELYVRRGAFEFNPARHDFGPKTLLGQHVSGKGFAEVEQAVTVIVRQRACARFISRQMATYFMGDDSPAQLVEAMADTFQATDGDIAATLRTLLLSKEFATAHAARFKDPMHYVLSSVRLAYDGRTISNSRPLLDWLNALGEAPFGRQTPDGYPLSAATWESPGQMSRRFEIARAIGTGNVHLFDPENGGTPTTTGFPQLSNRLYFEAIEPFLAPGTRTALNQANSPQEWNTFLLTSPEMNYE